MNDTRRFPGPLVVRHLASTTSIYEAVVRDALELIESTRAEHPELMDRYGELVDNLRIALDPTEQGTPAAIGAVCQRMTDWPT